MTFWIDLLRREQDGWQRDQLARILWARFRREFAPHALPLLAEEPVQYVQWELMQGGFEVRAGARFRDTWDIWLPATLTYRLYFPEAGGHELPERDVEELVSWLETGARPRDAWVRNHLLYRLAQRVAGRHLRRFLCAFDAAIPDKGKDWWILSGLSDARALPLLRFWATLPSDPDHEPAAAESPCCLPTRECLLTWVGVAAEAGVEITSAEQARAWLAGAERAGAAPELRFADALERVARVRRAGGEEQWEHLYGCWRRVEGSVR